MTTLGLSPSYAIFILSTESSLPENSLQNSSIIAFFHMTSITHCVEKKIILQVTVTFRSTMTVIYQNQ